MMENPNLPPDSEVVSPEFSGHLQLFCLVSTNKMVLLFVATAGMYSFCWFFMHWHKYKQSTDEPVWPIARAVFPVILMQSLVFAVDERLKKRKSITNGMRPVGQAL